MCMSHEDLFRGNWERSMCDLVVGWQLPELMGLMELDKNTTGRFSP